MCKKVGAVERKVQPGYSQPSSNSYSDWFCSDSFQFGSSNCWDSFCSDSFLFFVLTLSVLTKSAPPSVCAYWEHERPKGTPPTLPTNTITRRTTEKSFETRENNQVGRLPATNFLSAVRIVGRENCHGPKAVAESWTIINDHSPSCSIFNSGQNKFLGININTNSSFLPAARSATQVVVVRFNLLLRYFQRRPN